MVDSGSMNLMSHRVSSDSFLDNLKFLDFPMENIDGDVYEKEQEEEEEEEEEGVDWNAKLQSALGPIPVDFLSRCLNENIANGGSELKLNNSGRGTDEGGSKLTKPLHLIQDTSTMNKSERVQPLSPISVLEDNNSRMLATHIPRRARTKRSRPCGNKIWTCTVLERDFIKKKRKIPEKKTTTSSGALKRCSHCQVTQTPQWREGPMGPKTLCNACGVRYRSGRLFPEYRPMASPGFVPSLHSNSHRKVLEMRNKGGNMNLAITGAGTNSDTVPPGRRVKKAPPVYERENSPPPEFIPMSDYLLDCVLGSEVFNY